MQEPIPLAERLHRAPGWERFGTRIATTQTQDRTDPSDPSNPTATAEPAVATSLATAPATAPATERTGTSQPDPTWQTAETWEPSNPSLPPTLRVITHRRGPDGRPVEVRREEMVANHLLVQTRPGVGEAELKHLAAEAACTLRRKLHAPDTWIVGFQADGLPRLQAKVAAFRAASKSVLHAEPDYIVSASAVTPNDPSFAYQWDKQRIGAPACLGGLHPATARS